MEDQGFKLPPGTRRTADPPHLLDVVGDPDAVAALWFDHLLGDEDVAAFALETRHSDGTVETHAGAAELSVAAGTVDGRIDLDRLGCLADDPHVDPRVRRVAGRIYDWVVGDVTVPAVVPPAPVVRPGGRPRVRRRRSARRSTTTRRGGDPPPPPEPPSRPRERGNGS